jgi:hypothetical protein
MPELSPLWSRLYLAGQKLEGDEQLRQEHVAAASSDIAHAVRYELDTRVDPKDISPAALNQRLALIRRLRAQIATHGATVEWNESRTVSRWEANPGLTLIVLDNIEERLRRAAAGYG